MEGPRVMNEDVFPQYQAREEGIIVSFDDAEWQLKKVNIELKRVNRELNDLREIVTALQQGESLTDALGAVEEGKECQCGFSHRGLDKKEAMRILFKNLDSDATAWAEAEHLARMLTEQEPRVE
jgi:peptidyl-tRNA hydrolase